MDADLPTQVANYDFPFEQFFQCRHSWELPPQITATARIGAIADYAVLYAALEAEGIRLIHTPTEHQKCSELPHWYPLLADLTPKSIWFDTVPTTEQITREFEFPIFLKGARQTSKHQRKLSIIENVEALASALTAYQSDPVLWWQAVVCREYVQLRAVNDDHGDEIPSSFEFRTFWWKGQLVGVGRYWVDAPMYSWMAAEERAALAIAEEAARRLEVAFVAVNVAQRADGQWIVIEVNDGQESGYAGIAPFQLWRNVLAIERRNL